VKTQARLRGAYGKPVAKLGGQSVPLTPKQLRRFGEVLLEQVRAEARKDMQKSAGVGGGGPVPLPRTQKFLDSFSYRISGGSTVEIVSDWPTAEAHTLPIRSERDLDKKEAKRTPAFPMTWLARNRVPYAKLELSGGEVLIRTTPNPLQGESYWMHPGFLQYTFLQRGIRKGREIFSQEIARELVEKQLSEHGIFGR
jgi:hypothetical protein